MIAAGLWVTCAVCAAIAVWVLWTWEQPNRLLMVWLLALTLTATIVISRLPTEAIVRSDHREAFFLAWSVLDIALVVAIAAADGGAESPAALLFFLPLIFASLSYPLALVMVVSVLDLVGFLALGLFLGSGPDGPYMWLFSVCLSLTGVMCVWQAQISNRHRDELARISRADPLTGCLNRRGFEERLDAELDRGNRSGCPLALVLLDLDRFKEVNDTEGHAAGDELLCWTVSSIEAELRPMDAIGRLGGDEFAVLVPRASAVEGIEVAARVSEMLISRVRVTTGVACFPTNGIDRDQLHHHADLELYAAKRISVTGARLASRN